MKIMEGTYEVDNLNEQEIHYLSNDDVLVVGSWLWDEWRNVWRSRIVRTEYCLLVCCEERMISLEFQFSSSIQNTNGVVFTQLGTPNSSR